MARQALRPQPFVVVILAPLHGSSTQTGSLSCFGKRAAAALADTGVPLEELVVREVALAHANAGLVELLHASLPKRRYDRLEEAVCKVTSRGHQLPGCDQQDGRVVSVRATRDAFDALRSGGILQLSDRQLNLAESMREHGADTLQVFILADTVTYGGGSNATPTHFQIYGSGGGMKPGVQRYPLSSLVAALVDTADWLAKEPGGLKAQFHVMACHGHSGLLQALSSLHRPPPPGLLRLWAPDGPYPDYAAGPTVLAFALQHAGAASDADTWRWVSGLLGPLMVADSFTNESDQQEQEGARQRFVVDVPEDLERRVVADPGFKRLLAHLRGTLPKQGSGVVPLPVWGPCTVLDVLEDRSLPGQVLQCYVAAIKADQEAAKAGRRAEQPGEQAGSQGGCRRSSKRAKKQEQLCSRCGLQGQHGHQLEHHYKQVTPAAAGQH